MDAATFDPARAPGDFSDTELAACRLAGEVVWAWYLGMPPERVEIEPEEIDGGFIRYAEPWDEETALEILHTASICVAGSVCVAWLGRPDPLADDERDAVEELLAWAAVSSGTMVTIENARLSSAHLQLRELVLARLRARDLAATWRKVAHALIWSATLDAARIEQLMATAGPAGFGRYESTFDPILTQVTGMKARTTPRRPTHPLEPPRPRV